MLAWVSWLNISVLLGALSLALFNASKDQIARDFAYAYALISIGVLVREFYVPSITYIYCFLQIYGYLLYQHRITMIRRRDPGHFGSLYNLFSSLYLLKISQILFLGLLSLVHFCFSLCWPILSSVVSLESHIPSPLHDHVSTISVEYQSVSCQFHSAFMALGQHLIHYQAAEKHPNSRNRFPLS